MFLRISRPQIKWVTFLTLYLYYTKLSTVCQVFFHSFFIFFVDSIHPPLPVWHPVRTYSYRPSFKDHKESHGELQTASSVVFLYFTFICFRSWSHLLSSRFQYLLSSSSVSNRSSGCTDFHDTTCWVSSLRDSNWCRLYPHHDPTVSSTSGTFVTVPPLCRYSSTVSFRMFMFTCSWYG